jgi:hypothetical protein
MNGVLAALTIGNVNQANLVPQKAHAQEVVPFQPYVSALLGPLFRVSLTIPMPRPAASGTRRGLEGWQPGAEFKRLNGDHEAEDG